jgi:hypothetical protein
MLDWIGDTIFAIVTAVPALFVDQDSPRFFLKDWIRDNVSELFDWPSAGRVLPERNLRPRLIVIGSVFRKDSSKVLDVEHEQMIRALAPDRADQAFNIAILPGRGVRRGPVPDPVASENSDSCVSMV